LYLYAINTLNLPPSTFLDFTQLKPGLPKVPFC
jgi:hypothetical protein